MPSKNFWLPRLIRFLSLQGFLLAGCYALISLLGLSSLMQTKTDTIQTVMGLGLVCIGIGLFTDQFLQRKRSNNVDNRLKAIDKKQAQFNHMLNVLSQRLEEQARMFDEPEIALTAQMDESLTMRLRDLPAALRSENKPRRFGTTEAPSRIVPGNARLIGTASELLHDKQISISQDIFDSIYNIKNLDVVIQPVVRLPQRRPVMLEILTRLKADDGTLIPAQSFLEFVRDNGGTEQLDRVALQACLDMLLHRKEKGHELPYMLNITPDTLRDVPYMKQLLLFLRTRKDLAPRLIFEMRQRDYEGLQASSRHLLQSLSRLGCRFSMDHVVNPQLSRAFLQTHHISFVKLSASRLAHMGSGDQGHSTVHRIRNALTRDGVAMIAEHIADEETLLSVIELGMDYGQGYRFGKPVSQTEDSPIQVA